MPNQHVEDIEPNKVKVKIMDCLLQDTASRNSYCRCQYIVLTEA